MKPQQCDLSTGCQLAGQSAWACCWYRSEAEIAVSPKRSADAPRLMCELFAQVLQDLEAQHRQMHTGDMTQGTCTSRRAKRAFSWDKFFRGGGQ